MKFKFALIGLSVQAAFAANCPALLTALKMGAFDQIRTPAYYFKVKVTNDSAVNIDGIALGGVYRDTVGDEHSFLQGFTLEKVRAGSSRNGSFSTNIFSGTSSRSSG